MIRCQQQAAFVMVVITLIPALGMVGITLIPALGKQREVDLWESEDALICIMSFRPTRLNKETLTRKGGKGEVEKYYFQVCGKPWSRK